MDRLMRQGGTVYLLLAAYFILHAIARLAMPASLELDEGQQLFFSQSLSLGYDSQPPFYNWLQYGAVNILGVSVAALTILKNLLLFLSYVFLGLTANLVLRDRRLAAVATLGLMTITQVSFEAQRDLTHTVAVLFAACLFVYALVRTLKAPAAWTYALTGVAAGIGVLSKYNFVLLPLAALIALLPDRDFRARLFDWRVLLTMVIAAVIVAPHGWWFLDHMGVATDRTLGKLIDKDASRIKQIVEGFGALAGAIVAFAVPPLLVFGIAFGRRLVSARRASNPMSRLIGRMFAASLIMLVLLVLFAGAGDIRPRWLVPFFFPLPLWLCLEMEAAGEVSEEGPRRFAGIALAFMLVILLILGLRTPVMGELGRYERPNVPYGPAIEAILASNKDRPSLAVAVDQQLAGNIRLHGENIHVTVPGFEHLEPAYAFDAAHPVLVIWRGKGEPIPALPRELSDWLAARPAFKDLKPAAQDIARPYHYGRAGDVYHFSYAWIYPAATRGKDM
jgi:4-amino-4-deoxy-L-arabinose transferase-like glycosyltransferase